MADERIDIELVDRIPSSIDKKITGIANAARLAGEAITKLNTTLSAIDTNKVTKLANAQARLENASSKTAVAMQRIATESARTAAAQARANVATDRAAIVNTNLVTAQQRLSAAQNRVVASSHTAEIANQRLAIASSKAQAASVGLLTAQNKLINSTQQIELADKRLLIAKERISLASVREATLQNRLSMSTSQAAAAADRAAAAHLRLERAQTNTTRSSRGLTDAMASVVHRFMLLYGAVQSISGFVRMLDSFTLMENRLRAVGTAAEDVPALIARISASANSTRVPMQSAIELYSRLALSTKQFGYSQKELLQVTTSMNQAIRIGGSTTQEATNALIQLSQGMSSGRLQGDELRSVLEQLPIVADVISNHLGITRGELRKFGREGKLTTAAIMEAFIEAGPRLQEGFKKLRITVGESLVYLYNKVQMSVQAQLTLDKLSAAIMYLADNFDRLVPIIKKFIEVAAIMAGGSLISWLARVTTGAATAFAALGTVGTVATTIGGDIVTTTTKIDKLRIALNGLSLAAKGAVGLAALSSLWSVKESIDSVVEERQSHKVTMQRIKDQEGFAKVQSRLTKLLQEARANSDVQEEQRILKRLQENRTTWGGTPPPTSAPPPKKPKGPVEEDKTQIEFAIASTDFSGVRSQYDEIFAAQTKYKQNTELIAQAVWQGHMTQATANRILTKAEEEYYAVLRPMDAVNKALDRQQALIRMTNEDRDVANKLYETENIHVSRGLTFSKEVEAAYKTRLVLIQKQTDEWTRQRAIMESIQGRGMSGFNQNMSDLNGVGATREQKSDYLVGQNQELFQGTQAALDANTRAYETMYKKIDVLKENEYMSTEDVNKRKTSLWLEQNKLMLDSTGETLGNLAELQESSNRKMAAAGKVAAEFQVAYNGIRAISEAWASGPFPYNVPAIAAASTAFAIQEAKLNNLAGFAFGGDFTVGGTGGIDSQTVAFKASPGERVTISTPEQDARKGGGDTFNFHYHGGEGGSPVETEMEYTRFQRMSRRIVDDRASSRAQAVLQ